MADDNFRPFRSRDPVPREQADRALSEADDPLAELARLIGQSDPYNEPRRPETSYGPAPSHEADESSGRDRGAGEHRAERYAEEDSYDRPAVAPAPAADYPLHPPAERGHENGPAQGGRFFSGSAAQFSGFREEPSAGYREGSAPAPALHARELPAYATADSDQDYAQEQHDDGEAYAADSYYDEPQYDERPVPRRRGAVVLVMAVLGLAVIGIAGEFGYRAVFGGSMLPALPPIIKASNGPNRIVPSSNDSQPGNSSRTTVASAAPAEHLVSREEQPVTIDPPKPPPRVVASIPVIGGQSAISAAAAAPVASAPIVVSSPAPASSPWPPSPSAPIAAAASPPAPIPVQAATSPKRIHTVTIRPDQAVGDAAAMPPPAPPPAPAARSASRTVPAPSRPMPASPRPAPAKPTRTASTSPAGANAPLSIVPSGQMEPVAAPRARSMAVASAESVAPARAASSSGGGYSVQITSQRSEAEAQASFRELRSKFPHELSGHEPIIRRADLGAKGTYYRALVGPFASAEQAAQMCSGLKAAGGHCLVQRN